MDKHVSIQNKLLHNPNIQSSFQDIETFHQHPVRPIAADKFLVLIHKLLFLGRKFDLVLNNMLLLLCKAKQNNSIKFKNHIFTCFSLYLRHFCLGSSAHSMAFGHNSSSHNSVFLLINNSLKN